MRLCGILAFRDQLLAYCAESLLDSVADRHR